MSTLKIKWVCHVIYIVMSPYSLSLSLSDGITLLPMTIILPSLSYFLHKSSSFTYLPIFCTFTEDMLDLNLNFVNDDDTTAFRDVEESGTSNSSVVNADACISINADPGDGDVEEDFSSAAGAGAGESFSCFNFDILKGGDTRCSSTYDEDDRSHRLRESEFVTRRLFPEIRVLEVQHKKPKVQQNLLGKKSRRGPRSRSSQYRGVTFYRRTGRWESHIWDCGKQVYLGGFDTAHSAARAYDRAALKFRGVDADINFNVSDYEEDMKQTVNFSKEEFVHILRRQTTGYTRGSSKYRGVTVHKCGEWEAQMGQFLGKKAYDQDAIECNAREAVTNFEASNYKGKILPTIDHGNNRDLNLSLGISTPSIGSDSSRNENIEQASLDYVHDTLRLQQLENPVSALKGLLLTSGHPPSWTHVHPTFVPNNEGNATNSRAMAGLSQGPPYWAWKLHGHNHIPTTAAASSGFSASAATSGSHHLRETISMAHLNNPYSPLTSATSYAQYYHQTKPPPAPPP